MLSREQQGLVRLTTAIAHDLAQEGRLAAGYDCLLRGLRESIQAVKKEEQGAVELVLHYLGALDAYLRRHGVRTG